MSFRYTLPNLGEQTTTNNSVVIIGANGAGKSRLGAWIEMQDPHNIHRICGQRTLNFSNIAPLMSEFEAQERLFYGTKKRDDKLYRYFDPKTHKTDHITLLQNDADMVLTLLFAKNTSFGQQFMQECKLALSEGRPQPTPGETIIEQACSIWNTVITHRQLLLHNNTVECVSLDGTQKYLGMEMSDGEKSCLQLIAQCLTLANGKTILIDEPEIHMHPSIMNKLWFELEQARPDCLFIYITHDTQFAAAHESSDKIWVKSFDGKNWELEKITESFLPQQLLFDILGARKPVLFVEGTNDSLDTALYRELYPGYYIIPCGSCEKVIERTKAMRAEEQWHNLKCFGIIDRDFRTEPEISALEHHNIFTTEVAEIENLFCLDDLIRLIGTKCDIQSDIINNAIATTKHLFENEKDAHINDATIREIKYLLNSSKTKQDTECILAQYDKIQSEIRTKFNNVKSNDAILKIFNNKTLSNSIAEHFHITNGKSYMQLVLKLLRGDLHNQIAQIMYKYMPASAKIPHKG